MGEYEDTLRDMQKAFGIVPGFMKAIPADVLVKEWPLMKKYQLGEWQYPLNTGSTLGSQWRLT